MLIEFEVEKYVGDKMWLKSSLSKWYGMVEQAPSLFYAPDKNPIKISNVKIIC